MKLILKSLQLRKQKLYIFSKNMTILLMILIVISCKKDENKDDSIESQENKEIIEVNPPKKGNISESDFGIPSSEIVFVEGGSFHMGSPKGIGKNIEHPQHLVILDGFKITKYEITNEQFAKFLTAKGNQQGKRGKWFQGSDISEKDNIFTSRKGLEKRPVVRVTWEGAKAYAQWVGGSLPTEAQWEYAAKGGKKSKNYKFSGSNNLDEVGWFKINSGNRMHNVGEKKPNELGLYDMSGNVWEYTSDSWYRKYTDAYVKNPIYKEGNEYLRHGASAFCPESACRVANRSTNKEATRHNLGFRVVFPIK